MNRRPQPLQAELSDGMCEVACVKTPVSSETGNSRCDQETGALLMICHFSGAVKYPDRGSQQPVAPVSEIPSGGEGRNPVF